jgi:hypothetical protein
MSKYELPSGEASVEKTSSILGERDYTYPLSKNNRTKALTEALDELWLKQNRIDELEARLVIDTLNPNRREHVVQLTSRIDAVMKHIEERYDSQEPWTTPEEVKAILRGGLWS